ncbi:hypothetical protein QAD02_019502 [Eretmocerus hayati]|uniref:Uncharacterized protein n=1 Tax=Eretmocerus hayati TaxID=131215 RepID=A0ACC2PJF2_9HYME|nr:hypothetical protein QAD02_019502 [Eretmocerus hayati]
MTTTTSSAEYCIEEMVQVNITRGIAAPEFCDGNSEQMAYSSSYYPCIQSDVVSGSPCAFLSTISYTHTITQNNPVLAYSAEQPPHVLERQEEDPYPCALSVQKSVVAGSLAPMRATTWHPQDFFNPPPNYPVRFPCLKNMIGREEIDERGFRSLYANQKVNDQVINGMAVIMARRALERGSALIVVGKPSIGLSNWVVRNRVDQSDFLFLPLNDAVAEHWFGWAIDFKAKKLIFLDSLGGKPNPVWIARLCSFIKSVKFTNTEVQWKEWTSITTSHDLPSQHPTAGNERRDNCGVHLCVWMILICTGYYYEYCEEEMNGVRRMIATILMSKEFPKEAMSNRPDRRLDFLDPRQFNRCRLEMKHAESQKDVEFMNALSLLSNFLS